ncbi:MAG: transcription antitermination factor NusB [Bacteroidales bacterium]
MITRRLLRIKILQIIFSYKFSGGKTLPIAEKELDHSIKKFYDLYHQMTYLIIELKNMAETKTELAKAKKAPTYEDLNPNTKFIDNQLIAQLEKNAALNNYIHTNKLNWKKNRDFIKNLYNTVINTDAYKEYMNNPKQGYKADKDIVIKIYRVVIANYEPLYQLLEEQSIYWNDEIDLVISFIIKTIKEFRKDDGKDTPLMPLYKNEEDINFAKKLLRKTIQNFDEYNELIKQYSQNWDLERIAFMDILIMKLAITEILEFTSIPTRVTLDEYIEIAKNYSTEKSNIFINGILDKIIVKLKEENKIQKDGRGLIGEN